MNGNEEKRASRARVILSQVVACSALDVLLVDLGMSVSFVTTVLPVLLDAKEGLSINQYQASWFGSIVFLCQPLGSVLSGPLLDWVGRRRALFLVNIPHVIAWILMHYAWNVPMLFAANAMLGFGTGIMEAPSVTYVGEISEPSIRGILTICTFTFSSVGVFTALLLGTLLPWRQAALVCLAAPLTTMLLVLLIPESPIWLLAKGRRAEALRALRYVRGWAREDAVADEFRQLEAYHHTSRQCAVCVQKGTPQALPDCKHTRKNFVQKMIYRIRYLLLAKETLRPFLLVMGYFLIHTVCGLGPIRPNMMNVIQAFGMKDDPKRALVTVGILSITMTIVSASSVRLIGKRKLIISTTLCSAVCMAGLAVYARTNLSAEVFSYAPKTFPAELSSTPLVLFYLLVAFCLLGIPWVLLAEVFPFRSRGSATGLAAACSYVITFIAAKTNLELESYLHLSGAFGLYACFGFAGTVYLYLYLPETEGKTLVEIEQYYSGPQRVFADDPFINSFRKKGEEPVRVAESQGMLPVA